MGLADLCHVSLFVPRPWALRQALLTKLSASLGVNITKTTDVRATLVLSFRPPPLCPRLPLLSLFQCACNPDLMFVPSTRTYATTATRTLRTLRTLHQPFRLRELYRGTLWPLRDEVALCLTP